MEVETKTSHFACGSGGTYTYMICERKDGKFTSFVYYYLITINEKRNTLYTIVFIIIFIFVGFFQILAMFYVMFYVDVYCC